MSLLIDSHAHLDDPKFDEDRLQIIENLAKDRIEYVINPGADRPTSEAAYVLANEHEKIYAALGTHPHSADELTNEDIERYRELAKSDRVLAIGEIGLDYYYDNSPREIQKEAFIAQMKLAEELGLPVIIHTREASGDTYDIIESFKNRVYGVMHCYSGSAEMAKRYLELGYYISLAGPVTFKNARVSKEVAEIVPMDRLLVETDAPYLSPEPRRGRRNEPKNTLYVAEVIAEIKNMDLDDFIKQTNENTKKVFNIR